MQILQITDPHLYGSATGRLRGVETDPSLHAVLDDAFARLPDYSRGAGHRRFGAGRQAPAICAFAASSATLTKPVLCVPGNHDEPEAMRKELNGAPFQICGTHEIGDWHFIMLDSYDPGPCRRPPDARVNSRVSTPRWRAPRNMPWCACIITPSPWAAAGWTPSALPTPASFWRIIDAHAHVRAVVWGHVHQVYDGRARRRAPVCDTLHRRAIPAHERSLRGRLASARISDVSNCTPMAASTPRSTG